MEVPVLAFGEVALKKKVIHLLPYASSWLCGTIGFVNNEFNASVRPSAFGSASGMIKEALSMLPRLYSCEPETR